MLEDYGDEERVLGTITVWEPGARLAWTTRNDVTFAALSQGTRVTATGVVPDGSTARPSSRWCAWRRSARATRTTPGSSFRIGNGMLVLWGGGGAIGTDARLVYVDDLGAHFEHAKTAGGTVVSPIVELGYLAYTAQDCEGRHWQFMQAGPRICR